LQGADFKDEEIAERSTNSPRIENESWGFGITSENYMYPQLSFSAG